MEQDEPKELILLNNTVIMIRGKQTFYKRYHLELTVHSLESTKWSYIGFPDNFSGNKS